MASRTLYVLEGRRSTGSLYPVYSSHDLDKVKDIQRQLIFLVRAGDWASAWNYDGEATDGTTYHILAAAEIQE